jgi:type IV secretory pathway protease TraF
MKVLVPSLLQWMEERNRLPRVRISPDDLVGLVKAAIGTLQHQIVKDGRPATAAGDNMVDVKGRAVPELREATISASTLIALEHHVPQ